MSSAEAVLSTFLVRLALANSWGSGLNRALLRDDVELVPATRDQFPLNLNHSSYIVNSEHTIVLFQNSTRIRRLLLGVVRSFGK